MSSALIIALVAIVLGAGMLFYVIRLLARASFPPATSFAEGQRALSLWLMAAGGLFQGILITAIAAVLVWGNWPPALYERIIKILGWTLIASEVLQGLVMGGLLVGGPVGRFKFSGSKDGLGLDMDSRPDTTTTATQTTVVTATVAPAGTGAGGGTP